MKIALFGNKSIRAVFDSQVVRLDVIAPRVGGLDVRGRECEMHPFRIRRDHYLRFL